MFYKPVDEMSLRHLFSSRIGIEETKLEYLGPVLNTNTGKIESSPDCLLLDKRKTKYRIIRCEFKFLVINKIDFSENGHFDIAIIWALAAGCDLEKLKLDLLSQNECSEIMILGHLKTFKLLPVYCVPMVDVFNGIEHLEQVLLAREAHTVYSAYIAVCVYPKKFVLANMVKVLENRFQTVKRMVPQGRANAVSALLQTRPSVIKYMHGNQYRWNEDFNPESSIILIASLLSNRFLITIPTDDEINAVISE